jgi:zinc protease
VKRSLFLLLLIFSLFVNPATFAGQRRVQKPRQATAPAQATAIAPAPQPQAKFVNRQLPNGLEMIVLEDHSIPLVTCELAVRNVSFTEPPELNGL